MSTGRFQGLASPRKRRVHTFEAKVRPYRTMHNAKYKTGGLAAAASAIGKVFVFTIKEPQERLRLFAVARSPSGSLTTKIIPIFVTRSDIRIFFTTKIRRKSCRLSASLPRCPLRFHSANHQPNLLAVSFHRRSVQVLPSSKTCQKGFGHLLTAVLHGSPHNEITLFVTQ